VVRQPQQHRRRRLHRPAGAAADRANTYTYCDRDTYSYSHCNCNGYSHSHSYCNINSYRNAYGNSRAKDYADAEASPYTAAATLA
jgi:hypothetical protein